MNRLKVLIYHPNNVWAYQKGLESKVDELGIDIVAVSSSNAVVEHLSDSKILLADNSFPTELLPEARELCWIQVQGAGVDPWIQASLPQDVRISRVQGSFGHRMAEYAIGYMLAVAQRVPHVLKHQQNKQWERLHLDSLHGKSLGVAGVGNIGTRVCRLGAALGMTVHGLARHPKELKEVAVWYTPDELLEFVAELDYLVIALPLTENTRHLFTEKVFRAMRSTVWLVNIGRGSLIDEVALLQALKSEMVRGAVLDVFEQEPLPSDHPFWNRENVIITPHHSGATYVDEVLDVFIPNLARFRGGQSLLHEVDLLRGY